MPSVWRSVTFFLPTWNMEMCLWPACSLSLSLFKRYKKYNIYLQRWLSPPSSASLHTSWLVSNACSSPGHMSPGASPTPGTRWALHPVFSLLITMLRLIRTFMMLLSSAWREEGSWLSRSRMCKRPKGSANIWKVNQVVSDFLFLVSSLQVAAPPAW